MNKNILILLVILSCSGCVSLPFKDTKYVSLASADPQEVRQRFASLLPGDFQILTSMVFRYRFNSLFALGYTTVNTKNKSFGVSCFNPAGIKLFELTGNGDKVNRLFALDEFSKRGDIAGAVAEDVKRIYFDRLPLSLATVSKGKFRIIFRQPWKDGILEYIFAGPDRLLVQKNYYEGAKKIWGVFYYEYTLKDNKVYPKGIIFKHYRYRYQLISKLKEIRA